MLPYDRFTVSLDTELLAAFDGYISARGYASRSEAIRDLIRDTLITVQPQDKSASIVAVVTFVCDVRSTIASSRVRKTIMEAESLRPTFAQRPIDEGHDLWVVTVFGSPESAETLAGDLRAIRGVVDLHLITISAGASSARGS